MLDIRSDNAVKNREISREFNRKIDDISINGVILEPVHTLTPYGEGILNNRVDIELLPITREVIRHIVLNEELDNA